MTLTCKLNPRVQSQRSQKLSASFSMSHELDFTGLTTSASLMTTQEQDRNICREKHGVLSDCQVYMQTQETKFMRD